MVLPSGTLLQATGAGGVGSNFTRLFGAEEVETRYVVVSSVDGGEVKIVALQRTPGNQTARVVIAAEFILLEQDRINNSR